MKCPKCGQEKKIFAGVAYCDCGQFAQTQKQINEREKVKRAAEVEAVRAEIEEEKK